MLLRSSSSPVLQSLLPPLLSCHTEPLPDSKHESPAADPVFPKSLSLTSRGSSSSSITTCLTNLDPHLPSAHAACSSSFTHIRKVLSENDLCSLAPAGSSSTPARFAANSLLHDDNAEGCLSSDLELTVSRSHHPHVKKGRTPLLLGRWRSLGSELPSVFFDSDSAILEEGELASPNSSTENEEEEERGRRICVFDKLALPVGETSSAKTEGVNDSDVVNGSSLLQSISEKIGIQGVGCEKRGLEMNLSKHSADAAFSGRQESNYMDGQGTLRLYEGGTSTAVLAPQMHVQASQPPKYVYHGDSCEMALGAGAGGRGARPPSSAGGGRGGGEAGGHGGRNSDPTESHYQSMLKTNPGHPLILQNYAQYLTEVKRDYRRAEEFFHRAILANPSDGELLGQYAKMLWEVQQDRERAATYFERAVQAAPDNSYVMAAYASFLWSAEEEEEESVEEVKSSNSPNVPASIFSLVSAGPL